MLPAIEELIFEPAGQGLSHPVQQLGELNVMFPVVLFQKDLRLGKKDT